MGNDLRELLLDPQKYDEFKEDLDTIIFYQNTTLHGFCGSFPVRTKIGACKGLSVKCTGIHKIERTDTIIMQCDTYDGERYSSTYFIPLLDSTRMRLECHLV